MEPDKDVENFVRDYNTGSQIPDPPAFVDYNTLEAGQQPTRPSWRPANFARSTNRAVDIPLKQPLPAEEVVTPGQAGIGAGGGRSENGGSSRPGSAVANRPPSAAGNGIPPTGANPSARNVRPSPASSGAITTQHGTSRQGSLPTASQPGQSQPPLMPSAPLSASKGPSPSSRPSQSQDAHSEPIDPRADTMLKVGDNAYRVNLREDPQLGLANSSGPVGGSIGEQDDPLAKQEMALREASRGGARRGNDRPSNGVPRRGNDTSQPSGTGAPSSTPVASGSGSSGPVIVGGTSSSGVKNYQAQAGSAISGPPPSAAHAASPNPPTASFMIPPGNRSTSPIPVEEVVSTYQQHFPGERRSLSISRQNSVNGRRDGEQSVIGGSGSGSKARPVSPAREGHPGIGAHGSSRSPSPQPVSRPVSSASNPALQSQQHQQLNYHHPVQQGPLRATSPLGIAIDAAGRVAQDSLAERMYNQQNSNMQQEPQRTSYYGSQGPLPGPPPGHPLGPTPGSPLRQTYDTFTTPAEVGGMYSQPPQQRQYPQAPPPPQIFPPQPQQVAARQPAPSQFYNPHAPQNLPRQGTASSLYNPYSTAPQPGAQSSSGVPLNQPQYPAQQPPQQQAQFGYPDQSQHQARQPYGGYNQHATHAPNGYQPAVRSGDLEPPQGYAQQPPQSYRVPSPAPVRRSPSPAVSAASNPPTGQYTEDGQGVLFYGVLQIDFFRVADLTSSQ